MASAMRNDNAFGKLKGRSKIAKSLSEILKGTKQEASVAQTKLENYMEEVADKEGGEFDIEEMTIIFGSNEDSVIIYGSLNKDEEAVYQALYRINGPTMFIVGDAAFKIEDAIENLRKVKYGCK